MTAPPVGALAFTAGQAAALADLKYDLMDYWAKAGFIGPSIRPASGSGSTRLYDFKDLLKLATAGRMRGLGVGLDKIRLVLNRIDELEDVADLPDAFALALDENGTVLTAGLGDGLKAGAQVNIHGLPAGLLLLVPIESYAGELLRRIERGSNGTGKGKEFLGTIVR